jgi:hypothetical protein
MPAVVQISTVTFFPRTYSSYIDPGTPSERYGWVCECCGCPVIDVDEFLRSCKHRAANRDQRCAVSHCQIPGKVTLVHGDDYYALNGQVDTRYIEYFPSDMLFKEFEGAHYFPLAKQKQVWII